MKFLKLCIILLLTSFEVFSFNLKNEQIKLGIDVLIESDFKLVKNKKVALLTNIAGRTSKGELTAKILANTEHCKLSVIFTPEHGMNAKASAGEKVDDSSFGNIPIYSLYGNNRKPTKKQLANCDVVVVDLQDIGIRSYTYISTLFLLMQSCAENSVPIIVLDRPNPLGGITVDGNVAEKSKTSFVSIAPIAYIHGCTIGELAKMFNDQYWLKTKSKKKKCDLQIIKMKNWKRSDNWEETGLKWYATSPNIPTPDAIRGAATLGIWGELGIFSIGIGTDKPFQYIGSTNFDSGKILEQFKKFKVTGMTLNKTNYKANKGKDVEYKGFYLKFSANDNTEYYTNGIKLALAIRKANRVLFAKKNISKKAESMFKKVTGTDKLFTAFFNGKSDIAVLQYAKEGLSKYKQIRNKYLLY